jgi:hypothetical protein
MIAKLARGSWLSLLGLALAAFLAGCGGDANESEFDAENKGKGVANPKYAADTPETYRQFHQDAVDSSKAKGKAAPAPAAPAATPEPAKKP